MGDAHRTEPDGSLGSILGAQSIWSCRLDGTFTLRDRVPELRDAAIARIVHRGRCQMPDLVEDPADAADLIAFLRERFGGPP